MWIDRHIEAIGLISFLIFCSENAKIAQQKIRYRIVTGHYNYVAQISESETTR
jgi:hypothetical protein